LPYVELQPQSVEPLLLAGVRAYWTRKRDTRAQPRRQDIVPTEIKEWLPFVLLADVIDGGADFRYRLVGTRLQHFFSSAPTGNLMSGVLAPFGEETVQKTLETYRSVVTLGEPLRIKGDGAWYGQQRKQFEAILTPLSDDGGAINMIFGAFDFLWNFPDSIAPAKADDDQTLKAAASALR
jgi:hypothetical protein